MIEIGGKPILWHIMKYYSFFGIRRFVLALGYKGDIIKQFFYNYRYSGSDFTMNLNPKEEINFFNQSDEKNWQITFIDTGQETLKGGRIKKLEPYIESDNFHLTYGDGISDINLSLICGVKMKIYLNVEVGTPKLTFGSKGLKFLKNFEKIQIEKQLFLEFFY